MQRGWLRVAVRYPLVVLVEQGRLTQAEAAREMGLSVRQVRRVLKRYRESGGELESLTYQRRHPPTNALTERVLQELLRLHHEYPHWSAPAIAEALLATGGGGVDRATPPPRVGGGPGGAWRPPGPPPPGCGERGGEAPPPATGGQRAALRWAPSAS